ncbi:hypothetical protein M0812_24690 [Anaeramoeba flamelloides]|uniref:PHD-type domain-containing protein n=1 Tax=Anaeramoeba flamelloides TaxID=1746091 RepID=A0AAV7YIR4_9EUKA|nr:hypothetical protein M0812_24690 [Anaeramoeba flamelloides]
MSTYWNITTLLAEEENQTLKFVEQSKRLDFLKAYFRSPSRNISLDNDQEGNEDLLKKDENSQQESSSEESSSEEEETDEEEEKEKEKDPNKTNSYCCGEEKDDEWIQCDNPRCKKKWYHYSCVGITEEPTSNWYCQECLNDRNKKKPRAVKKVTKIRTVVAQSSSQNLIEVGTSASLPVWIGSFWYNAGVVELIKPTAFRRQFRDNLLADPVSISLLSKCPHWYFFGIFVAATNGDQNLSEVMSIALASRLLTIFDHSLQIAVHSHNEEKKFSMNFKKKPTNSSKDHISLNLFKPRHISAIYTNEEDLLEKLSTLEKIFYDFSLKNQSLFKEWKDRRTNKIKPSEFTEKLKKRKRVN